MFFENLEDRTLYSTTIANGQLVLAKTPVIPTVTLPKTLTAAADTKGAKSSDSAGKTSAASSSSTSSTATSKPEFYSKGVMRFLVRNGYLTQQEADKSKGRRTTVDDLVQIKRDAQLLGASEAAVQHAISLILKGKNSDAQRTVIADGLNLPPEALKTKLGPRGLLQYVSNLQLVGAGDKASDPKVWKDVAVRGTDAVLADAVRDSLGIPAAAAKGKTAKQLLKDSANIELLGADARSLKAWQGLDKLKKGKIKLNQFTQHYSDGSDIGAADQQTSQAGSNVAGNVQSGAVNEAKQVSQDLGQNFSHAPSGSGSSAASPSVGGAGSQAQQPSGGTQVDPIIAAFAGYATNGNGQQSDTGAAADAVVVVHGNSDGSYTTTVYEMDDNGNPVVVATETFTDPDGDGQYQGDHGGSGNKPADGVYPAEKTSDGGYVYDPGDSSGNGSGGNGNGDDSNNNSDQKKDDDNKDDDNKDDDQKSDSSDTSSSATPNPENDNVDPHAWVNFLLTTPMGADELNAMADQIGMMQGGGYTDPTQETGGSLFSRAAFYSSKLGSTQIPGMTSSGGDVDYPDEIHDGISIDKQQLLAIQLRAGGTLVDPEHYHQPQRVPGTLNPVIGPIGVHGGGGTTAVSNSTFSTRTISVAASAVSTTALTHSVKVKVTATIHG